LAEVLNFGGEIERGFLNDDLHGLATRHRREEGHFAHAVQRGVKI
jgi:hypothetical protein